MPDSDGTNAVPEAPEISTFVTVGFNSTSRHLESLAAPIKGTVKQTEAKEEVDQQGHMSVVFLPKPRNDLIYGHLPLLAQTASLAEPQRTRVRIVPLDSKHEIRISESLGLPRAGVVGLMEGAPGAEALLSYVRSKVEPIDVPWLKEAAEAKYLGLKLGEEEVITKKVKK